MQQVQTPGSIIDETPSDCTCSTPPLALVTVILEGPAEVREDADLNVQFVQPVSTGMETQRYPATSGRGENDYITGRRCVPAIAAMAVPMEDSRPAETQTGTCNCDCSERGSAVSITAAKRNEQRERKKVVTDCSR